MRRVGQSADHAMTHPEIGGIDHRFGEDPGNEDAGGQRPLTSLSPAVALDPEKCAHGLGAWGHRIQRHAVKNQEPPEGQAKDRGNYTMSLAMIMNAFIFGVRMR